MPTVVRVASRIVRFPPLCCCCCRPDPEDFVETEFTRSDELSRAYADDQALALRSVHTETKRFGVPICRTCLSHIHLLEDAAGARQNAWRCVWVGVPVAGLGLYIGFLGLTAPDLGTGLFGLLCCFVGAAIGSLGYAYYDHAANQLVARARRKLTPGCVCKLYPVFYLGWKGGNVHSFAFVSDAYAAAFSEDNGHNILSPHDQTGD